MSLHQIEIKEKEKCNSEELQKILHKTENFYLNVEETVRIRRILTANGIEFDPAGVIRPFPTMVFDEVSFYAEKKDIRGLNYILESLNFPPLENSAWIKREDIDIFIYCLNNVNRYVEIKDLEDQWKITLRNASADLLIDKIKVCRITHNS